MRVILATGELGSKIEGFELVENFIGKYDLVLYKFDKREFYIENIVCSFNTIPSKTELSDIIGNKNLIIDCSCKTIGWEQIIPIICASSKKRNSISKYYKGAVDWVNKYKPTLSSTTDLEEIETFFNLLTS